MVNGHDLLRVMRSDNYLHGNHVRWSRQFLKLTTGQLARKLRIREESVCKFERVGGMLALMPVEVEDRAKSYFIEQINSKLKN